MLTKSFRVLVLSAGFVIAGLFLTALQVNAAIVSPPFDDRVFTPGNSYRGSFTVYFTDEDPSVLYLTLAKMEINDVTGAKQAIYVDGSEQALANWVTLDTNVVNRPRGVTFTEGDNGTVINYSVNIPADAEPGGNYAVVIISRLPHDSNLNGNAGDVDTDLGVGADITYQLISNIEGDEIYNTRLEGFETVNYWTREPQWLFSSLPVGFDASFHNNGNVHVIPRGNIEIFQGEDNKIANVALNSSQVRVFPKKSRVYQNAWTEEGIESMETEAAIREAEAQLPQSFFEHVIYQATHFRFGMYTAKLAGFAGNQPPYFAEQTFWVIPWHLILTIIVVTLVVYLGWRINRKLRGSEYVSKNSKKYRKATRGK